MKQADYFKKHKEALSKGGRCSVFAVHIGDPKMPHEYPARVDADGDPLHHSFTQIMWQNGVQGWQEVKDLDEGVKSKPKTKKDEISSEA